MNMKNSTHFKRGYSPRRALGLGIETKILNWLHDAGISEFELNPELLIDVFESVSLNPDNDLFIDDKFPEWIHFQTCVADFDVDNCNLVSLFGCPSAVGGYFSCQNNKISDLIGGPEIVKDSYYVSNSSLTSLNGIARKIDRDFIGVGLPKKFMPEIIARMSDIKGEIILQEE